MSKIIQYIYKSKLLFLVIIIFASSVNIVKAADIPASASRATGVAPLSVHFNADITASSPTERSFHNLEYSWNFGDSSAGNWGTDGLPKNTDKGPVAFHVYETVGTFTATLTIRNSSGIVDTNSWEITVTDPDDYYEGANTRCISTGVDFTGCPVGATQITTSNLANMPTWTVSNQRVLFRRGDTWTAPAGLYGDYSANAQNVTVGAFGSCTSPDSMGICSNAPEITVTASGEYPFINLHNTQNWKIENLSFTGAKNVNGVLGANINMRQLLVYRLKTRGFIVPIGNGHWRGNDSELILENAFVSNDARDADTQCFYGGGDRFALVGNQFHNSDTSHVVRVFWSHVGVIGHNYISGSSLNNTNGRCALKFHGPKHGIEVGAFAETGGYGLPYPSQFVAVHNNIFGSSGPWPVGFGPQDSGSDERLSDILVEKNRFLPDYGNKSPILVMQGLRIQARHVTARNNIFDTSYQSSDPSDYIGIVVADTGVTLSNDYVNIYNNTLYYDGNSMQNGIAGIAVQDADATNINITNNFVSFPNATQGKFLVVDNDARAVSNNNIMTNSPYFLDPNNVDLLLRNFSLTSQSTEAIDQGTIVPVLDDFTGTYRTGTYDIGAYNYNSGDTTAPSSPSGLSVL